MSSPAVVFNAERAQPRPARSLLAPFKEAAKKCLRWAAHTNVGRRAVNYLFAEAIAENPEFVLEPLFSRLNGNATLDTIRWPERLGGFEDLAFLFSSNHLNVGVAVLAFDEAALSVPADPRT